MKKLNIEYLRVMAIIFTIIVHVTNVYIYSINLITPSYFTIATFYNAISRICVPIFFLISGNLLIKKDYDIKKNNEKIKRIIIILTFWSIIYYLIKVINDSNIRLSSAFIKSFVNAYATSNHLWYLYAFFGIYLALPYIQNMCKNISDELKIRYIKLWFVFSGLIPVVAAVYNIITKENFELNYPIPLINATYYLGYFVIGYFIEELINKVEDKRKVNYTCGIIFILSTFVTFILTTIISLNLGKVYDNFVWYRSIFIALSAISIFTLFLNNMNKFKNPLILKLSNHTFGIYLVHIIFLTVLKSYISIININPLYGVPILTIIIYIISLLFCIIISKIPQINKLLKI